MFKTEYISDPSRFYKLLLSPDIEIGQVHIVNSDVIMCQYTSTDEYVQSNPNVNVIIGAFTTAYARIQLYSALGALGRSVAYLDTDSLIVKQPRNTPLPLDMGPFLGQYKNEITEQYSARAQLIEFVGLCPKSYAYRVLTEDGKDEYCVKCKGVTLNYNGLKKINFNTMKNALFKSGTQSTTSMESANKTQFKRNIFDASIHSIEVSKTLSLTNNKRAKVANSHHTLPYGY